MNRIICVHSYKGGTGKTLVSINLAVKLSQNARVLLVEADFLMPCFFQIFPNDKRKSYYNDFYSDHHVPLKECIFESSIKNLDLIYSSPDYDPSDKVFSNDQKWHLSRLKALLNQLGRLSPLYDYIILDTAPGRNFVAISNLILSNLVLIVLRPTEYSVMGTKVMLEEVYQKTKPDTLLPCYIILNQVPLPKSKAMRSQLENWKSILMTIPRVKEFEIIPICLETALQSAIGNVIFSEGEFIKHIDRIYDIIVNHF